MLDLDTFFSPRFTMDTLFLTCLIIGGGLLLVSLLFSDAEVDLDTDTDGIDSQALKVLSLRTMTYFLFGFGAIGFLLRDVGAMALLFGIVGGFVCTAVAEKVFRYLKRTESGAMPDDRSLVGCAGVMTQPFGPSGTGKATIQVGGRTHEMVVRPDETSAGDPATWKQIVVVEVAGGTLRVAPF